MKLIPQSLDEEVQRYFEAKHEMEDWQQRVKLTQQLMEQEEQSYQTITDNYANKNIVGKAKILLGRAIQGQALEKTTRKKLEQNIINNIGTLQERLEHAQGEVDIAIEDMHSAQEDYLSQLFLFPGTKKRLQEIYGGQFTDIKVDGPLKSIEVYFRQGTSEIHSAHGSTTGVGPAGTQNTIIATSMEIHTLMKEHVAGFVEANIDPIRTEVVRRAKPYKQVTVYRAQPVSKGD